MPARKNPMTKKDFNRIAYQLAMAEPARPQDAITAWKRACEAVAIAAKSSNPRFDKQRFLSACRFDYWTDRMPPR